MLKQVTCVAYILLSKLSVWLRFTKRKQLLLFFCFVCACFDWSAEIPEVRHPQKF